MRRWPEALAVVLLFLAAALAATGHHWTPPAESAWFASGWRHGLVRWWCTELGTGYPLLASGLGAGLSPLRALDGGQMAPYFLLAGLGGFVAVRRLNGTLLVAVIVGVACVVADRFAARASVLTAQAAAWLPWMAAAAIGGRWPAFALTAALAILAAGMPVTPAFGVIVLMLGTAGAVVTTCRRRVALGLAAVTGDMGLMAWTMLFLRYVRLLSAVGVVTALLCLAWAARQAASAAAARRLLAMLLAAMLAAGLSAAQWLPWLELWRGSHQPRMAAAVTRPDEGRADEAALESAARQPRILVPPGSDTPLAANDSLRFRGLCNAAIDTPWPLPRVAATLAWLEDAARHEGVARERWLALLRVGAEFPPNGGLEATGLRLYPEAWLCPRWISAPSREATLALVRDPNWRPEGYAILEHEAVAAPRRGRVGEILWSESGRHRVTLRTYCEQPHYLVLGRAAAPGWRVGIDGVWTGAERVDAVFLGAAVPAGTHRIDFVYNPATVRVGLFLSLLSLALTAGWWAAAGRARP